jgi:hypothetical protein
VTLRCASVTIPTPLTYMKTRPTSQSSAPPYIDKGCQ